MVQLGKQTITSDGPRFIVFEAGPTHNGFDSAKQLIDAAAEAGGDAVKFQVLDPDRLVSNKSQLFSYEVLLEKSTGMRETISEPLYDILSRRALSRDEWRKLKRYSDQLDLEFFATAGFEDEIDFLADIGCSSIKIASGDVTHFPLIRHAARTGLCIQLDTGNSSLEEVAKAVNVIVAEGNTNIVIHHCPSGYPADASSVNLNVIARLVERFPDFAIGFSDHSPGWEMDIAAIAMGAELVEKTITFDRTTRSVEHIMSLEPPEMKEFVSSIRNLEVAFGPRERVFSDEQREKSRAVRRSAFLRKAVEEGALLSSAEIFFSRPGFGVSPARYESIASYRFREPLAAGHMITEDDLVAGASS